jgi:photosystem II stability/assembly factor-like uncharacterized protein
MSLRLYAGLLVLSLLVAVAASANQIPGVSHRSKFYDSATHGGNLFVVGYPGLLLRSSSSGGDFTPLSVPTEDALFSIDINRSGLGAIVGRSGLVLITADGGVTWTKTNALASSAEDKAHLFAVDVLETGAIVAVGDFATIVRSTDGGKTWQRLRFDPTDPTVGKAAEASAGLLGAEENENAGFEGEARLTSVAFGDDLHGFVVGEFGIILKSDDGGVTWARQHAPSDKLLFSVHASSATHAVASGSDGSIAETRDGLTWTRVPAPTTNHLFGVWTSDETTLAVGEDGTAVQRRGPDGQFQVVPTHVHTWLSSVALQDGKHGLVTGGLGHLLSTQDAGQTFAHIVGE